MLGAASTVVIKRHETRPARNHINMRPHALILKFYRKWMRFKDVAGEGASHDTRWGTALP